MDERVHDRSEPETEGPAVIVADTDEPAAVDRRRLLGAIGTGTAVVLVGCLDDDEPDDDPAANGETYEIVFLDDDERVEVDVAADDELLYPALDAGVDIPYSCEVGTCGQCTVRYDGDAGDVVTHDGNDFLEAEQIEDGWVLTCVAYATDDAELEVAHPDDE